MRGLVLFSDIYRLNLKQSVFCYCIINTCYRRMLKIYIVFFNHVHPTQQFLIHLTTSTSLLFKVLPTELHPSYILAYPLLEYIAQNDLSHRDTANVTDWRSLKSAKRRPLNSDFTLREHRKVTRRTHF